MRRVGHRRAILADARTPGGASLPDAIISRSICSRRASRRARDSASICLLQVVTERRRDGRLVHSATARWRRRRRYRRRRHAPSICRTMLQRRGAHATMPDDAMIKTPNARGLRLQGRELAGRHRRRLLGPRRRAPARHICDAGRRRRRRYSRSRARAARAAPSPPRRAATQAAGRRARIAAAERAASATRITPPPRPTVHRGQRADAARARRARGASLGLAAARRVLADLGCGSGLSARGRRPRCRRPRRRARHAVPAAARAPASSYTPTLRPGSRCGRAAARRRDQHLDSAVALRRRRRRRGRGHVAAALCAVANALRPGAALVAQCTRRRRGRGGVRGGGGGGVWRRRARD